MEFEGSYKPRRRPRYYWILVLIPIGILFYFFTKNEKARVNEPERLTLLQFRNETITLDNVLKGKFYANSFNGSFLDATTLQFFSRRGDLITYNITSGERSVVISIAEFYENLNYHRPTSCDFSPSKKYILIQYDPQRVYRHSTVALYAIYDIDKKTFAALSSSSQNNVEDARRIQLARWSETKDTLVFVNGNDVFLSDVFGNPKRITYTGSRVVYNGVADWVYEEEMFSSNQAVWLYDEDTVAFVTFNDTLVDVIQFPVYANLQYPIYEGIPYPKTGKRNPETAITVYSKGITRKIVFPSYIPTDNYIATVKWMHDELVFKILNRFQNVSMTVVCDSSTLCEVIHSQEQPNGWIDVGQLVEFGNNFLSTESIKQNTYSYKHLVEFSKNSVVKVLSKGDFSVDRILSVVGENVYFMSNGHLYKQGKKLRCITCDSTEFACQSNDIVMATTSDKYFVHTCFNGFESVPIVAVYSLEPIRKLVTLETNAHLAKSIERVQFPTTKDMKFETNGFEVNMRLFLPFDFDEGKKYPLLIDVYGGPGSIRINNRFRVDWSTSLVSSKNIIYGMIDGRGSGGQSDEFLFQIYRKLGTAEVEDQINGTKYMLSQLSFIDPAKTAIWGWSYGGFVVAKAMGIDVDNVFKCGISVAPVTNWFFYDTIYTERYMSLPGDNLENYNKSDVTNHIENFKQKKYLLIHGTADDNVHYQQSMYLSRALELNDVLFFQQTYPDESHGLSSVRHHLYHTLERFLFESCFKS